MKKIDMTIFQMIKVFSSENDKTVSLNYRHDQRLKQRGFSLIELMIVIAILGIVITIALPSFQNTVKSSRMASKSNDLLAGLNIARQAAIARGTTVIVCNSNNSDTANPDCNNGDWATGFLVYAKPATTTVGTTDANQTYNSAVDEIIYQLDLGQSDAYNVTPASLSDFIRFDNQGLNFSGGQIDIELCDDRVGAFGRSISISTAGRARTDVFDCT